MQTYVSAMREIHLIGLTTAQCSKMLFVGALEARHVNIAVSIK